LIGGAGLNNICLHLEGISTTLPGSLISAFAFSTNVPESQAAAVVAAVNDGEVLSLTGGCFDLAICMWKAVS
jgi:hypothetical protein